MITCKTKLSESLTARKISGQLIVALMILMVVSVSTQSAVLELTYTFDIPSVESVEIDGDYYSRVVLPGSPNSGQVGYPALPAKGARILIPYGEKVVNVTVTTGSKQIVGTGYYIEPVEQPFSLSTAPADIPPLYIDSVAYSKNSPLPETRFISKSVHQSRGYQVLLLKLHPVGYIPLSGELFSYTELHVHVSTQATDHQPPLFRNHPEDSRNVLAMVDNPSVIASYTSAATRGRANYDMLIITPTPLVDAFLPLKDYHDTTGILTEIHTLDQIGGSDAHTIRDYIRQEYLNEGIEYVLLGGDDEIISALDAYVITFDSPGLPIDSSMPCDFYFSHLDGTFNYDGDALWAEPTDGEGGGDIDLFPEVHVGRVSANTVQEVNNLVNKTMAYFASEGDYLQKVLLAAEQLNFTGFGEYGGYAMDEMVDGAISHGYETVGFPSTVYQLEKLYDLLSMPYNYWAYSEIIDRMNAGVHIIDHLGHSGIQYAMRTDATIISQQLTNTEYFFAYAEGCSAGAFDYWDCWAEYITVKLSTGAFGCVANARAGLGARSTAHMVHVFNREFWDAIYKNGEAGPQLGRAMSDARADHAYHIDDPGIRWTVYGTTLFGDPAAAIKTVHSLALSFPNGTPTQLLPHEVTTFDVVVYGVGEGTPVNGSGLLHYSIDGGDLVAVPMTPLSDTLYQAALPAMDCGSSIEFYTSVEEAYTVQRKYYPEPDEPRIAITVTDEVVVFEDDFETDKGWTLSGGLWERGIPLGLGGEELQYPAPDPTEGCNGVSVMGYNLSGDYENSLPETYVTSPVFDCSEMQNIHLRFCRWLAVEAPAYDHARVQVSNNGTAWTTLWENPATIAEFYWNEIDYDISAIANNQPNVYLRWTMGPTDGGLVYAGWNIDDVQVVSLACETYICGDIDGNGENPNISDLTYLVDYLFGGGPVPPEINACDMNGDGNGPDITDLTYMVDYLFNGGPELIC